MSQSAPANNPEQWLAQFVRLLLECPAMQNAAGRDTLRHYLPENLKFDVPKQAGTSDREAVTALAYQCAGKAGGVAALLDVLEQFNGETSPFKALTAFLEAQPAPPPTAFPQNEASQEQVVRRISLDNSTYNEFGQTRVKNTGGNSVTGSTVKGNVTTNEFNGPVNIYQDGKERPARSPLAPPPAPEHFAGRERELAELEEWLRERPGGKVALTALRGQGGIGKTTLARQLAHQLYTGQLFGAVLWVEVKPQPDPWPILRGWAAYCGLAADMAAPHWDILAGQVRNGWGESLAGRALVVFDDVWSDGTEVVRQLLKALPEGVTVLITSRDKGVAATLAAGRTKEVTTLPAAEAVALLREYLPAGEWPPAELEELARALGGHALALTLAAKRLNKENYPVAALPRHLAQYAQGLPTGSALEKLQMGAGFTDKADSLKVALAHSYNVLQPDRQARFRALGALVYDQPFDLRLLAGLWAAPANEEEGMPAEETAREWADELCDLSLIEAATETELGEGWYRQHPVLHAYAAALLRANPQEASAARDRYYDRATAIARAFLELQDKPEEWGFLTPYLPHIHATGDAIYSLHQARPDDEATARRALDFAGNIYWYLSRRQEVHKVEWLEMGLAAARTLAERSDESLFLNQLGLYHDNRGDMKQALAYYKQSLPIDKKLGDKQGRAAILSNIGGVYSALGEKAKALDYYEQALPLERAVGDRAGEAATLNNIGAVYRALGETAKALEYYEQSLSLERAVGNRAGEAVTLSNIGLVYSALGDKAKALGYYEQALPLRRAVGDRAGEATTLHNIGSVYEALGEKAKALDYYEQALPLRRAVGDRAGEAATLHNIGSVYEALGEKAKALDYYEQALPLRRAVGDRAGEAVTCNNIGVVYYDTGRLREAVEYLARCVALDEAVQHPDLAQDRARLERWRAKLAAQEGA